MSVTPDYSKLDTGLQMALRAFEENRRGRSSDDGISVTLRFDGELAPIEAIGFETHMVSGDEALGVVRFKDIPALTAHHAVRWIAAGRERHVDLHTAAAEAKARATTAANVGGAGDGLWHAVVATGVLTQAGNATGKDVIVAVIDTGIDFTHPMFMSQLTPTKKTRIKRIWDQGLVPGAVADCPAVALLASANTYGVEYDEAEINAALSGGPAVLHKDCVGHGTHVAGIAAGGVFFPAGGDAKRVGIAPEADIIAVKLLDTPDSVKFRLPAGPGAEVGFTARFRDAVLYCLRTAKALAKPVVINMSFGNTAEPGDGLDDDAKWVDERMDPAQVAGPLNFPKGAVIVKSSGNSGDITDRALARIVVPAAGEITLPVELTDTRAGLQTKWKTCAHVVHKPPIGVDIWYRRATPHTAVTFALRLPDQAGFSAAKAIGGTFSTGFRPVAPASVTLVPVADTDHTAFLNHEDNPAAVHPAGTVRRHLLSFFVRPKVSGGIVSYHPGIYELKIKAPAGTELFAFCDQIGWARGKIVQFKHATTMQDGSAPHANVTVSSEFTSVDTLGRHAITVAACDDKNGNTADPDYQAIASFSSRGPLRDFSDPPGSLALIATKPDIAAPGVKIDAAEGVDTEPPPLPRLPPWATGIRFVEKSGTSMAAPVVAGVIALMLDKKFDLNTTEVRTILNAAARAGVKPSALPARERAYGSGMVTALQSHVNTP